MVVTQPAVLVAASRMLGDRTPQQLQSDVTATAEKDVNAVSIKAKADTADDAARIANAVAAAVVGVSYNETVRVLDLAARSVSDPAQARAYRCSGQDRSAHADRERSSASIQPDLAQPAA